MRYTRISIKSDLSWTKLTNVKLLKEIKKLNPKFICEVISDGCEGYLKDGLIIMYNPKKQILENITYKNGGIAPISCLHPINSLIQELSLKKVNTAPFHRCGLLYQDKKVWSLSKLPSGFVIKDDLNLRDTDEFIISDNIIVNGNLNLERSKIQSLHNITINGDLTVTYTNIGVHSGVIVKGKIITDFGVLSEYTLEEAIAVSAYCIDKYGFKPYDKSSTCTSGRVYSSLKDNIKIDKKYYDKAKKVLKWFKNNKSSSFLREVSKVLGYCYVPINGLAFIASGVHYYNGQMKEEKSDSEYVGKVGTKHDFGILTVIKTGKYFDRYANCEFEFCMFVDENNNIIKWFSKKTYCGVTDFEKVKCVAKIKSHNEFNGVKQTIIINPELRKI